MRREVSYEMQRRARTEQAKVIRRRAILEAAQRAWTGSTFEEFTMAAVARRARLAKGTVYLYFATKETVLLELLEERLGRWLAELEARLARGEVPPEPDGAARHLASTLLADPELVRLLMILGTVLEQNVPEERIRAFKVWLHDRLARAGAALDRALPFLGSWSGVKLLIHLQALVCGIGQLAQPAAAVARVLAAPELAAFRVDFEGELRDALSALMRGAAAARASGRAERTPGAKGRPS